jgi:hypothetical protein
VLGQRPAGTTTDANETVGTTEVRSLRDADGEFTQAAEQGKRGRVQLALAAALLVLLPLPAARRQGLGQRALLRLLQRPPQVTAVRLIAGSLGRFWPDFRTQEERPLILLVCEVAMSVTPAIHRRAARGLLLAAAVLLLVPVLRADDKGYQPKRVQTKDTKPKAQLNRDAASNEKYVRELAEMFLDAVVKHDDLTVRTNLSKALRQAIEERGTRTVARWAEEARPSDNLTGFTITRTSYDTEGDDALIKGAFLGEINGRPVRYPFTLRIIREEQDSPYRVDSYRVDRR